MKKSNLAGKLLLGTSLLWSTLAMGADMIITSEIPMATNPSPYIAQFIESVERETEGRITGQYFPAAQLYNDRDGLAALGTGAVHMVWPVSSRLETMDIRTGIISLPFALSADDLTDSCFSSGFTKQITEYLSPKGLTVLGFLRTADLLFIMRDKDIKTTADLKGQKIRVIGGKVMLDAVRSVGASPVSMAASEMSAAISQGAIDGALTSPAGWADLIGDTGKYATSVPGMALATSAVVADKAWFDSLSEADQAVLKSVLDEIIERQWIETVQKDEELIAKMVAQGGNHRVMDETEISIVQAKFSDATGDFIKKNQKAIDQTDALRKECRGNGK